jgi:hypothetical protein
MARIRSEEIVLMSGLVFFTNMYLSDALSSYIIYK